MRSRGNAVAGYCPSPYCTCALSTPRISLGRSKSVICAVCAVPRLGMWCAGEERCAEGPQGLECRGVLPGGYYTGYYPSPPGIAPYLYCQGPTIARTPFLRPPGPLQGPSWTPPHTPGSSHSDTRLRTNRARFSLINPEVSHKTGVSPKMSHEAWHTPYLKNRSISHDLKFSDFHIS